MPIKRALVIVSGDKGIETVTDMAFQTASRMSAQVVGLLAQSSSMHTMWPGDAVAPDTLTLLLEEAEKARAEELKRARAAFAAVAGRYRKVDSQFAAEEGLVEDVVTRRARAADLVVIGSPSRLDSQYWRLVRDAALFRSGRPLLVVPAHGAVSGLPDRVLIAWKESLEAARALTAALPFLVEAAEVKLVSVDEGEPATGSLRGVEEFVQLHYADLRTEIVKPGTAHAGEVLLGRAEGMGALLVMGAYSRWRWQEKIFGGVTEYMLRQATVPVLMMH